MVGGQILVEAAAREIAARESNSNGINKNDALGVLAQPAAEKSGFERTARRSEEDHEKLARRFLFTLRRSCILTCDLSSSLA